jgi:hypothetical protein
MNIIRKLKAISYSINLVSKYNSNGITYYYIPIYNVYYIKFNIYV